MSVRSEDNILEYTNITGGRHETEFLEDGIYEWIKSFQGLDVVSIGQTGRNDLSISIVLKKSATEVYIPKLLLVDYDGLTGPPSRKYTFEDASKDLVLNSWSLFQKNQDGIPLNRLKIKRKIDEKDVLMMIKSFRNKESIGQPVETAFLDVLNASGNVLMTTGIPIGQVGAFNVFELINEGFSFCRRNQNAKTIRFRHTHPGSWEGAKRAFLQSWKFSEADVKTNETIREMMNQDEILKKVHLDAFIVYIRPTVKGFNESAEHFWQIIETKGYRLSGK